MAPDMNRDEERRARKLKDAHVFSLNQLEGVFIQTETTSIHVA